VLSDEQKREVLQEGQRFRLMGMNPRHVINLPLSQDTSDELYLAWCRPVLHEATGFADTICERLERQCWELESIEDAGLSGRIRYLVSVAAYAAAVLEASNALPLASKALFFRTVHWALEDRRPDATHDLSNVLGPLVMRSGVLRREQSDVLGTWIWLHLGDQDSTRDFLWVKSSLRFMSCYGDAIEEEFLPTARSLWKRQPWSASPSIKGEVSREAAAAIAEQYIEENPSAGFEGVSHVVAWDEIKCRKPALYGMLDDRLKEMWVAYLVQPGIWIRSSEILLIECSTGRIAYAGSAFDEG